jgi:hypothetical protein
MSEFVREKSPYFMKDKLILINPGEGSEDKLPPPARPSFTDVLV